MQAASIGTPYLPDLRDASSLPLPRQQRRGLALASLQKNQPEVHSLRFAVRFEGRKVLVLTCAVQLASGFGTGVGQPGFAQPNGSKRNTLFDTHRAAVLHGH